jgi:tetratricopeptide (TPR) repeat protein
MKRFAAVCFMIGFLLFLPQEVLAQRSRKISPEKKADSLNRLGLSFNGKGNQQKAELYYKQAINISRKYKLKKELGYSLYNLSSLYTETANYEIAIALGEECVEILQAFDDKETVARCLLNLEKCYRRHGIMIRAMKYADSAVKTLRTFKHDKLLELALWRQGEIYVQWNTALAIPMFKEALALAKKIPEYESIDNILASLGHCYTDPYAGTVNLQLAESYFKQSLEAALAYDPGDVNNCRIYYGKICTSNGNYKEAEYQLKLVYDQAVAANKSDEQSIVAFCLSEVYFETKDFQKAYTYLKEHQALEEHYDAEKKKGTADKMAFNFKTERIETQNKLLKQERELQRVKLEQESFRKSVKIWVSITVTIFLVLVTVFLYRFFKKKNQLLSKKSDTLRRQLLLTQMSPHFITSSIDSIKRLIREDKPDIAATYLSKFARLTRQILENSTGDYISLEEEIAMVTNYLMVQQLLHANGFSFTIDDDGLDAEGIYLPPMLTQPVLAHTIGRIKNVACPSVEVSYKQKGGRLSFEVKDNGRALRPGEKQSILGSADVRITAERLNVTHMYSEAIKIKEINHDGVTGIMIGFDIPYVEDN